MGKNCTNVTIEGTAELTRINKAFQGKITKSSTHKIH